MVQNPLGALRVVITKISAGRFFRTWPWVAFTSMVMEFGLGHVLSSSGLMRTGFRMAGSPPWPGHGPPEGRASVSPACVSPMTSGREPGHRARAPGQTGLECTLAGLDLVSAHGLCSGAPGPHP